MARIAGVDLPRDKRVEIGLTYIYGIGRTSATRILTEAGVNPDIRCRDLTDDDVKKISAVIDETQTVEGDLRREIALNIKRLQEIGCYRGIRHRKGLPVRGQKTKTNARTRREARQIVDHKQVLVNGKQVNIPSYLIKAGDVIEIKEGKKSSQRYKDIVEVTGGRLVPEWLESDIENLKGTVKELPTREAIDVPVDEMMIVELYSK